MNFLSSTNKWTGLAATAVLLLQFTLNSPTAIAQSAVPTPPGEFEPVDTVWMSSPTYEPVVGRPMSDVQRDMIGALYGYTMVDMLVNGDADARSITNDLAAHGIPTSHVRFHNITHNDVWMRDMGPFFLRGEDNLSVVNWQFNGWNYDPYLQHNWWKKDDRVDVAVANMLRIPYIDSSMTIEGGALDFNGKGMMITNEDVVFDRNPQYNYSKDVAEQEFKRVLNVKKIIWVKGHVLSDAHTTYGRLPYPPYPYTTLATGGHVDEFVRFVDPHTILLAEVTAEEAAQNPYAAADRAMLEANYNILLQATDQDGNPFKIVRIPNADPIFYTMHPGDATYDFLTLLTFRDGSTFPTTGEPVSFIEANSYTNFLIANGVVLMSKFWKPGRPDIIAQHDAQALQVMQSVFPGRKIVQIDSENVNLDGGGIHCITYQQPSIPPTAK